jgi:hypothetical protein
MSKITSNISLNNPFNNNNNLNNKNILNNYSLLNQNALTEENLINIPNDEAFTICQRCKQKDSVFSCIVCESYKFLCTKCDNYIHSLPSKQAHHRIAAITNSKKQENHSKDDSKISNKIEDNYISNVNPNKSNSNFNNNNNNNLNNSLDLNYKFNLSPINRLNNLGKEKDNSAAEYNTLLNHNSNSTANNIYNNNNFDLGSKGENNLNRNLISYGSVDDSLANLNGIKNISNNEGANKNNFMNIQESSNVNSYAGGFNSFKIPNAPSFSREYVYEIKVILKN